MTTNEAVTELVQTAFEERGGTAHCAYGWCEVYVTGKTTGDWQEAKVIGEKHLPCIRHLVNVPNEMFLAKAQEMMAA